MCIIFLRILGKSGAGVRFPSGFQGVNTTNVIQNKTKRTTVKNECFEEAKAVMNSGDNLTTPHDSTKAEDMTHKHTDGKGHDITPKTLQAGRRMPTLQEKKMQWNAMEWKQGRETP